MTQSIENTLEITSGREKIVGCNAFVVGKSDDFILKKRKKQYENQYLSLSNISTDLKNKKLPLKEERLMSKTSDIIGQGNLKGMKILVVEDAGINQFVAEQFLNQWNTRLVFAENGKEAVEKVKIYDFDIILMDLQMPVMNGYEASQIIRKLENRKKDIPIIALTALTLKQVKTQIENSGINDYLPKPFNPVDLYNKIVRWTKIEVEPLTQENLKQRLQKNNEGGDIISIENIKKLTNNNPDFLKRFLIITEKSFNELSINFRKSVENSDYERLRVVIHKIKPAVTIMGFDAMKKELENGKYYFQENEFLKLKETSKNIAILSKELIKFLHLRFEN